MARTALPRQQWEPWCVGGDVLYVMSMPTIYAVSSEKGLKAADMFYGPIGPVACMRGWLTYTI